MNIQVITKAKSVIAESPVYDEINRQLYWIDNQSPILHHYNFHSLQYDKIDLPKPLRCLDIKPDKKLVGIMENQFVEIDCATQTIKTIIHAILKNSVLFNDGKLDAKGRFWVGTMDPEFQSSIGALYCIDEHLAVVQKERNMITSNGLGWSKDNKLFYLTDSTKRKIYQYDFCIETGVISNKKTFVEVPEEDGFPDGLCVDEHGYVWSAHWSGSRVTCYAPSGKIVKVITMPVRHVTSCCFVEHTLVVTSANYDFQGRNDLGEDAGRIFQVALDN